MFFPCFCLPEFLLKVGRWVFNYFMAPRYFDCDIWVTCFKVFNFLNKLEVHLDCLFHCFFLPELLLKIGRKFFYCFTGLRHFDCKGLTVLEGYLQLMSKYMAGFIYYILMSLAGSDTVWLGIAKSKVKIFATYRKCWFTQGH